MTLENAFLIALAFFLVLLNGFFVAAEFAIVKLRHTRVEELAAGHSWRGRLLERVHAGLDAYLSACQLGITLASLGLGWLGEPAFARLLEPALAMLGVFDARTVHSIAFAISFGIISFLHIVIGELAPKSLAIRQPETISLWTAAPLFAFYWLMYPFIWVLNTSANGLLGWFGLRREDHAGDEMPYSHSELRTILQPKKLVETQPEKAAVPKAESDLTKLLSHALDLPSLTVSDVMHSRREMVALHTAMTQPHVQAVLLRQRFSRYPLLDHERGDCLGVLHLKDVFFEGPGLDYMDRLKRQLRPAVQVREDEPLTGLLQRFREGVPQLAIVIDEAAFPIGLVTLEDVLEVVFGEFHDEHGARRGRPNARRIHRHDDGSLEVFGTLPIYRLERELARDLVGDGSNIATVAGFISQELGRIPVAGDVVALEGLTLTVEEANGPRVERVRIRPTVKPASEDGSAVAASGSNAVGGMASTAASEVASDRQGNPAKDAQPFREAPLLHTTDSADAGEAATGRTPR